MIYGFSDDGVLATTTFSKAFSKSFGSSDASTSRAISRKRLWRAASVSFGFGSLREKDDTDFRFLACLAGPDVIFLFSPQFAILSFSHSTFTAKWARIRRLSCERRFKRGNARLQHGNLLAVCKDASKRVFGRQQPFPTKMSLYRCCHA
jgi:hypothetical protein